METRQITHIRKTTPGTHPSHITHFQWYDQNGKQWYGTRAEMVQFVRSHANAAYTFVDGAKAFLHVVEHWVQTYPDNTKKDNLLNLQTF